MTELNLDYLLKEISPESPCGENLEEDPTFLKLEDEARFVEETQIGEIKTPAKEPEWVVVRGLSLELLERTRDIRVAMYLSCALVRTDGFNGLYQSLRLLRVWLEKFWDAVYPLQDPEDDYPIFRINTLTSLNDYTLIRKPVNHISLTQSPLGSFSWRDIELSEDKLTPLDDEQKPDQSMIEAAFNGTGEAEFNGTDLEFMQAQAKWLNLSLEELQGIINVITEKVGTAYVPDLSAIKSLLQGILHLLKKHIQQRQEQTLENEETESSVQATSNTESNKKVSTQAGINNRADVVRSIDEICKYFHRYEPSSPVPFLLLRAKKLLTMNFMEILHDMSPDTVSQAENICGVKNNDEKG